METSTPTSPDKRGRPPRSAFDLSSSLDQGALGCDVAATSDNGMSRRTALVFDGVAEDQEP